MTIANFKALVVGLINRDASIFTVSTIDHVVEAMNSARRAAQRAHTFELLRDDVFLTTSVAGAAWTTGCKTTPGGATAVLMRRIDSVWQYSPQSVGIATAYLRTYRVPFETTGSFKRELGIYAGAVSQSSLQSSSIARPFAYTNGENLYVTTISTATPFLVNGIKWLDDLVIGSTADIFLTYFTDWLLWGTLMQLNQFLKDSEKVPIDMALVNRAWETVKQMDGTIANQGDVSLD
jgi:hypothetical protein